MKKQPSARTGAFSMLELVLVMAIILILAALLLPTLADAKRRASRAQCLSHLKQIGLGFHSFAHDHNSLFPMQVSTNAGGSLEFFLAGKNVVGDFYFAFRHFQPLACELQTPKILICPADYRDASASFKDLCNANVSYFVGATASYSQPDSILLGDRNLVRIGPGSGSVIVLSGQTVEWSSELHNRSGNLLFADGHTETYNNAQLQTVAQHLPGTTILPPTVPGTVVVKPSSSPSPLARQPVARQGGGAGLLSALEESLQTKSTVITNKSALTDSGPPPAVSSKDPSRTNTIVAAVRPERAMPPEAVAANSTPRQSLSETNATNASVATSASSVAKMTDNERGVLASDGWPVNLAQTIGEWAQRFPWLLLLLLFVALVALEVMRRRRARKKKAEVMEEADA